MISANNLKWLVYVSPQLAFVPEAQRPVIAVVEMGQEPFDDFEEANDAGVEFTATANTRGYNWEGRRQYGIKTWQEAVEQALMEVRSEEFRRPKVSALRKQGWMCHMFGLDGAAFLLNSDGRAEPIYHTADAAWEALVRRAAL